MYKFPEKPKRRHQSVRKSDDPQSRKTLLSEYTAKEAPTPNIVFLSQRGASLPKIEKNSDLKLPRFNDNLYRGHNVSLKSDKKNLHTSSLI